MNEKSEYIAPSFEVEAVESNDIMLDSLEHIPFDQLSSASNW